MFDLEAPGSREELKVRQMRRFSRFGKQAPESYACDDCNAAMRCALAFEPECADRCGLGPYCLELAGAAALLAAGLTVELLKGGMRLPGRFLSWLECR